jgi:hypothetical protein
MLCRIDIVKQRLSRLGAAIGVLALTACSAASVQSQLEPSVTTCPATQSTLQFAVGTAKFPDGMVGLNAVETLRQTAGGACVVGDSVLSNAPTIVGPAGFKVPATADAYADAGTGSISGTLVTSIAALPPATTFNPTGAAFTGIASDSGIFPAGQTNSNLPVNLVPYPEPFYAANDPGLVAAGTALGGSLPALIFNYIGGPPAFTPPGHTSTRDGTFVNTDLGFTLGFNEFVATPVAGTYTLNVVIPTGINATTGLSSTATKSATASLAVLTGLPTWTAAPTFVPDGTGGGTVTTNFAAGGGITEEYIEVVDIGALSGGKFSGWSCEPALVAGGPYYYTFKVTPGAATVTIPDNIGPAPPGKAQGHTICTGADDTTAGADAIYAAGGDGVAVYGIAVDYPLYNSTFPNSNGVAAPTILTGTQADITSSLGTYFNDTAILPESSARRGGAAATRP